MNNFKFLLIITFLITSFFAFSQNFMPLSSQITSLPEYAINGKWIDFDNDDDLDIIIQGKLFFNIGNDSFQYVTNIYSGVLYDFNNDGWVDLLVNDSVFFNNQGAVSLISDSCYVLNSNLSVYHFNYIGDLFNEGKMGITKQVYNPYYLSTHYYSSKSSDSCGFFDLGEIPYGTIIYDFNNDGYMDIFKQDSWNPSAYFNNGIGKNPKFSYTSALDAINIKYFDDIADFNNDGFLDILYMTNVYLNDSNASFNYYSSNGVFHSNVYLQKFVDLNNDGKLDVLQGFYNSQIAETYLFKNDSNLIYSLDSSFSTGGIAKLILPADYDNDGDLDLFICSEKATSPGYITALYRNDSIPPNTPPTAPQVMWTEMDSNKIIFRWRPATDVETPQATLSYNLMVGTSPKGIDITSPMADTVTGFRRVVELGNAQLNNFYILDKSNFALGDTIYWSVQTIDNGFGYSPFSKENRAIVCGSLSAPLFDTICANDSIIWRGNTYKTSGRFYQSSSVSLPPTSTCDSSFVLDLHIKPAWFQTQNIDLCSGSYHNWYGQKLMNSGIYHQFLTSTQGCDSIERLVLNIHPDITNVQTADLCLGDSVALGNNWLSAAGVYIDSLQTTFGCDSLVKLTISISPDDSTVVQSGDSLIAQSSSAKIVWWDCQKQQLVYGVGGQVFVPNYNGHFAVRLTQNGCTYLTRCFEVTGVGIDQPAPSKGHPIIDIWPNPAKDKIFIKSSENISKVSLIDSYGKIVLELTELKSKDFEMDISTLANGIYLMKMEWENGVEMRKMVKE